MSNTYSSDPDASAMYAELLKRGVFKADPDAAAMAHELRRRGVIKDPTQGGLVKPAPATAQQAFDAGTDKPDPNDLLGGAHLAPQKPLYAPGPNLVDKFAGNVVTNAKNIGQFAGDTGRYAGDIAGAVGALASGNEDNDLQAHVANLAKPFQTFAKTNAAIAPKAAAVQTIIARMHQIADRGTPEAAAEYAGHVAQLKKMGVPPEAYGGTTASEDSERAAKQLGQFAFNNPIDTALLGLGGAGELAGTVGNVARIGEALGTGASSGRVAEIADNIARASHAMGTGGVSELVRAAKRGAAAEEAANAATVSKALEAPKELPESPATAGLQAARASKSLIAPAPEPVAKPLQALATAEASIPKPVPPVETPAASRAISRMRSKAATAPAQASPVLPAISNPPGLAEGAEKAIFQQAAAHLDNQIASGAAAPEEAHALVTRIAGNAAKLAEPGPIEPATEPAGGGPDRPVGLPGGEVQSAAEPTATRRRTAPNPAAAALPESETRQAATGSPGTESQPAAKVAPKTPVKASTSPAQSEKTIKLPITQNEAFTVQDSLTPELRGKLSNALKGKGTGTVELTPQEVGQIKIANIGTKYPNDPDVKSLKAKLESPDISANIRKVPEAASEPKKMASPEHQGSINNTQPVPQNFKVVMNSAGAPTIAPPKPSILSRVGDWAKDSLLAKAIAQIKHGVNPEGLSEAAGKTARLLREFGADESQFNTSRNYRGLPGEKVFDRLSQQQQLDAIDNMERGINTHASPEVQKAIDLFSQLRDEQTERLKTLAPGLVKDFKENYVPRVVKNPGKANPTDIYTGNTSVYGSKGFTKGRTYQYAKDTVAAGHELASYNPFTLLKLRGAEMEKAITGTRAWNAMKLDGNLKFYSNPAAAPEGWRPINNKAAEVWESRATTKADGTPGARENIKHGDWYAPDPVATVFENAHSTGFSQQPVYKLLRRTTNSMNAMQLGLSGFHATTTGINSSVGKFANGFLQMEDALMTKSLPGVGRAALTGIKGVIPGVAPAEAMSIGGKMRQEFRLPGTQGQAIGESTRAMIAGGGNAASSYDHLLSQAGEMSAADKFKAGVKARNPVQVGSAAAQLVMEGQMYPLMEQMVPRVKLSAMHDLAQAELSRLPATASADDVRKVMAKAVDSIDNRFGQVNYDNLFANKHFKDSMFLLMRAPGWKLTFREFGGAILDGLTTAGRAKTGGRIITPRMAFAMSSFIVPALWGATLYALRGKSPKTVGDLYRPEIDDKGTRVSLPTYVNKDLSTLVHAPGQEIQNSASPLVSTTKELITGKDYANRDIVPAKDRGLKRGADYIKYFLGRSFTPISISQSESEKGKPRKTPLQKAGNLVGVTIVPHPQPKQKSSLYGAIK